MIEVDVELFAKLCGQPGRLQDLVHGYIGALFAQASLSAACSCYENIRSEYSRLVPLGFATRS